MRMLAVFEKSERIRHIGHLDIQRSMQRGLRRSGLPVAYSNGFNPHILVSFASALSTGACGLREIMDVAMAEPTDEASFLAKMNGAMPPELQIKECRAVDDRHPAAMSLVRAAVYDLTIYDTDDAETIIPAVPSLMEKDSVFAMRKTKTTLKECDIRPMIFSLRGEGRHLFAVLELTEKSACKPGMLMEALQRESGLRHDTRILITRTGLLGEDADGNLIPLEKL